MALAPISGVKDGKLLVQMMTHIVPQVKNRTSSNPPATAPLGYRCTPQPSLGSWGRGLFLEATSRVTDFRIPTVDLRTLPMELGEENALTALLWSRTDLLLKRCSHLRLLGRF